MMELLPIDAADAQELLNPSSWTPERQARFLSLLSENGNVRDSALACGLSSQSVYKLRRRDPLFARAWHAALLLARDHSEQVLASRALEGVEEPIYYRGELVGTRRRYDNRLLLAHMARLDRIVDAEAVKDAARFDELVALVAGERAPDDLTGEDPHLPLGREDFAASKREDARRAKHHELPFERSKARDEERRAEIEDAGEQAFAEAERAWGGWFSQACGAVDRIDVLRARTLSTVSTAALATVPAPEPAPRVWSLSGDLISP